jgi:uncharacterized membrane protein
VINPSFWPSPPTPKRTGAEQDFYAAWGVKHEGELDHVAAAVLEKDADGKLKMDRHDSTAKHLAWGGALLGGALVVLAPPLGAAALVGTGAGAGGIVGHFWHNIRSTFRPRRRASPWRQSPSRSRRQPEFPRSVDG